MKGHKGPAPRWIGRRVVRSVVGRRVCWLLCGVAAGAAAVKMKGSDCPNIDDRGCLITTLAYLAAA
jgi:hypothetical protein